MKLSTEIRDTVNYNIVYNTFKDDTRKQNTTYHVGGCFWGPALHWAGAASPGCCEGTHRTWEAVENQTGIQGSRPGPPITSLTKLPGFSWFWLVLPYGIWKKIPLLLWGPTGFGPCILCLFDCSLQRSRLVFTGLPRWSPSPPPLCPITEHLHSQGPPGGLPAAEERPCLERHPERSLPRSDTLRKSVRLQLSTEDATPVISFELDLP